MSKPRPGTLLRFPDGISILPVVTGFSTGDGLRSVAELPDAILLEEPHGAGLDLVA